jgi:molybdenum cofactor cytidylyltransferase
MARSPSVCGVVLAAGDSTRMGRDKAFLQWRGKSFLVGAIEALIPHTELVIVVAGNNAPTVAPVVYGQGASLAVNPAPERGQFSSLQAGLQDILNRGRDAAIISLVDRPPVDADTVALLRAAFFDAINRGKWAVVPEHGGRHGHPILVAREMIEAFLRAPAGATARDVEHANQQHIEYVPVEDPLVIANVDTPEDYDKLVNSTTR